MKDKTLAKFNKLSPKQRTIAVISAIVVIIILIIGHVSTPSRSVASYCAVYSQEKTRLTKLPSGSYPSGVFNVSINTAGEIATSFSRLDRVAPTEIEPDVKTLGKLYAKMDSDPSQAIAASLSGASIDEALKAWTAQQCKI